MSQTSSRPPSEANNRAYWFASAPKQEADIMATSTTATGANHSRDEDDVRDNSKCLCADMCPNSQREQHLYTDNN
ncbi:unnamed protein product, partial [Oppiella nova]